MYIKAKRYRDEDGKLRSYRDIAEELKSRVAYTTIRNWMKKDFPKLYRALQKKYEEPYDKYKGSGHGRYSIMNFERGAMEHIEDLLNSFWAVEDDVERTEIISVKGQVNSPPSGPG